MQRYKHFMREIGKHSSNFCQANSNISFYSFWSLYSILHYDFSRNILHLQFTKILQHKIVYTKNFSSGEFLEAFQHWIFLLLYFLQILRYLMLSWRFYWWKIELSISPKNLLYQQITSESDHSIFPSLKSPYPSSTLFMFYSCPFPQSRHSNHVSNYYRFLIPSQTDKKC